MKKQTITIFITMISMIMMSAISTFASNNYSRQSNRIEELNLSSEQEEKLKSNREETQKKMETIHKKISVAKKTQYNLLKNRTFEKSDLLKQIQVVENLSREKEIIKLDSLDEIRSFLSDGQWEKFIQMFEKRGKRRFRGKGSKRSSYGFRGKRGGRRGHYNSDSDYSYGDNSTPPEFEE